MTKNTKIFILLVLFFPGFYGYLGLNIGQLLYLFIVFAYAIIYLFTSCSFNKRIIPKNSITFLLLFLLLNIEYLISTIYNFKTNYLSMGDIIECFRPLIYLLTYFGVFIVFQATKAQESAFSSIDYLDKCVFIFSLFEWLKFLRVFEPIFKLYTPFSYGFINYVRFFGSTGFAYNYAWLISVCLFWTLFRAKKINLKICLKFLYYALLIILTGSRTGFLAFASCIFFSFVFLKKTRKFLIFSLLFGSIFVFILYILNIEVVVTSIDYILRLVKLILLKEGEDGSYASRNVQKEIALDRFRTSPILGIASNKTGRDPIENFYYHHLQNWGILGFINYLIIILGFIFVGKKRYWKFLFIVIIISFIIAFSTPIFDQIRVFNLIYLIIAIMQIGIIKEKKNV